MNALLKFSKHFVIPAAFVLAANLNAQAQNPVESTHVDEKYAYTTVVYKSSAATDKDVLTALENDFSIGDVVRVTLAPPPAPISAISASEPVYADKSKGEDSWLPATAKSAENLTASNNPAPDTKSPVKTGVIASKPTPVATETLASKPVMAAKPALTESVEKAAVAAPVQTQTTAEAPVNTTSSASVKAKTSSTAKAHKSAKKAGKKSSPKLKLKNRKHGRQRYACPTF